MERELWSSLYRLVRDCDATPWWSLDSFFRLRDRGGLFLGCDSRSTNLLGVRASELAGRLATGSIAVAIDDEQTT
jgi:hypothetical protein